nr:hypothetical protein [Luteimonas aquatica]
MRAAQVEGARVDGRQPAPALQRMQRDQEAGDHEEHEHRLVAVVAERVEQAPGQHLNQRGLAQRDAQGEVVEHHQQDRDAAQGVDAGIARGRFTFPGEGGPHARFRAGGAYFLGAKIALR